MKNMHYKEKLEHIQRRIGVFEAAYCRARDAGDTYIEFEFTPQERRAAEVLGYKVVLGVKHDFVYI